MARRRKSRSKQKRPTPRRDRGPAEAPPPKHRASLRAALPPAIIGTLFVGLAAWSWRKWPDILIDAGKEVYVPWRLTEGDVFSRDFEFVVGVLSPYFNAALFRLFGVSFSTLFAANLAILAAIVWLLYRLFVRVAGRTDATIVCVVFLMLLGFSQYSNISNYNYVFPYRHEMTHGLVLCLLQVWAFAKYVETNRRWPLAIVGLCLGALAVGKVEIFVPAAATAAAAAMLIAIKHCPSLKQAAMASGITVAAALGPILLAVGLLAINLPPAEAIRVAFQNWIAATDPKLTATYSFYNQLMGLNNPAYALTRMSIASLSAVAVVVGGVVVDRVLPRPRRMRPVLLGVAGVISFFAAWLAVPAQSWRMVPAGFPLICAAAVIMFVRGAVGAEAGTAEYRRYFVLSLWSVLALLLPAKLGLMPQITHYGFVLMMPATVLVVCCLASFVPAYLRWGAQPGDWFRAIMLGLVAVFVLRYFQVSNTYYAFRAMPYGSGADLTYHDPRVGPRVQVTAETTAYLREHMPEDSTLMVLPHGIMINYMLRKRNPTGHILLTPWEMAVAGGEDEVLGDIARRPPDFAVVLQMSMREHGYDYFGVPGYGEQITNWLEENYQAVRVFHGAGRTGAIEMQSIVYERRGLRSATRQDSPAPTRSPSAVPPN